MARPGKSPLRLSRELDIKYLRRHAQVVLQFVKAAGHVHVHAFRSSAGTAFVQLCSLSSSCLCFAMHRVQACHAIRPQLLACRMLINLWPGFGGALAAQSGGGSGCERFYGIANTILCLAGSTIPPLAASSALGNKLNMVHIQNSTLAGGVAISSACEMNLGPAGECGAQP